MTNDVIQMNPENVIRAMTVRIGELERDVLLQQEATRAVSEEWRKTLDRLAELEVEEA
jgi:hypothetical protein